MSDRIYSKCGMRCDLCLVYRPNVEQNDRREEICKVFSKVWQGFEPNPREIICDGCFTNKADAVLFSPGCETRQCVMEKKLEHCGYCSKYPCVNFPAEPTQEEKIHKIDVEKQWTWEDEKLMEAYACKKNMDQFRNTTYHSYVMGVDNSILELKQQGFIIENDGDNYMVSFSADKALVWEEYITKHLELGYWNEYLTEDKVVFLFHLEDGIKKYEVYHFSNDEVLALCEKLCECKFTSIKDMLIGNHFYNKIIGK